MLFNSCASRAPRQYVYQPADGGLVILREGRRAYAPRRAPKVVHRAIEAGNRLQFMPYRYGGGHARVQDSGYDCSGAVSYVLIQSGLL
ncbi:MAG: peptidoglycan endopeptidase, partial [Verrucomicrobiales bacterium]